MSDASVPIEAVVSLRRAVFISFVLQVTGSVASTVFTSVNICFIIALLVPSLVAAVYFTGIAIFGPLQSECSFGFRKVVHRSCRPSLQCLVVVAGAFAVVVTNLLLILLSFLTFLLLLSFPC